MFALQAASTEPIQWCHPWERITRLPEGGGWGGGEGGGGGKSVPLTRRRSNPSALHTAGFLFPRCVGSVLPKSGLGVVAGTASLDWSMISISSGNPPSLQPLLIDCLPSILLFFLPRSFRAPQCCLVQVSPRYYPGAVVRPGTVFCPGALHSLLVGCVLTFPVLSLAWWLIILDPSACCSQNVWVCSIPRPGSHFLRFLQAVAGSANQMAPFSPSAAVLEFMLTLLRVLQLVVANRVAPLRDAGHVGFEVSAMLLQMLYRCVILLFCILDILHCSLYQPSLDDHDPSDSCYSCNASCICVPTS